MIFFDDGSPEVEYPSDADFDSESEDESENEKEEDGGVETHDSGADGEAATFCTGDAIPRVQRKHAREERREIRAQKRFVALIACPYMTKFFFRVHCFFGAELSAGGYRNITTVDHFTVHRHLRYCTNSLNRPTNAATISSGLPLSAPRSGSCLSATIETHMMKLWHIINRKCSH